MISPLASVERAMRTIAVLGCLFGLLLSGEVRAADLAGENDPRFRAAFEVWLADYDEAALPALAALARDGNRAAQVLLALSDVITPLQGPWLAGLPRAERIALMRQPGGLSGRSWMEAAAVDTPLAAAWLSLWRGADRDEVALARAFAAMGEQRAVSEALIAMSLSDRRGVAVLADDPVYPPSLRFLIWREWAGDPVNELRIAREVAALPPGDPQIMVVTGERPGPVERATWLAESAPAAPLRAFCDFVCPDSRASCLDAAYALHGNNAEIDGFGSPVESLISSARWAMTPRGRGMVLRRTLPTKPVLRSRVLGEIAGRDACFGAALAGEASRFTE
jgi:hypothetical protein